MIPKIAWTHWDGEMSWLRRRGLDTFKQHNPDWKLYVCTTDENIGKYGLHPALAGDWTGWCNLLSAGGFAIDSDIIWCNPIPDEWLDCDVCAQTGSKGNVYQMAALGVVPQNDLMVGAVSYCQRNAERMMDYVKDVFDIDDDIYQEFGVNALLAVTKGDIQRFGKIHRISHEDFCFYDWSNGPRQMWGKNEPSQVLPDTVIGVHWYGGSKLSKKYEYGAKENGPSWLERLASGGV